MNIISTLFFRPCILFFDEIDSFCNSRNENESDSSRRQKTEFLVQMQNKSQENFFIFGATNVPWLLDPAMKRRFDKRIIFYLPDFYERKKLFEKNFSNTQVSLTKKEIEKLASLSENFSAENIRLVVSDAIMNKFRFVVSCSHFKKLENGLWIVSSPQQEGSVQTSLYDIGPENFFFDFQLQDFLDQFNIIKPISNEEIEKYKEFQREFGEENDYSVIFFF